MAGAHPKRGAAQEANDALLYPINGGGVLIATGVQRIDYVVPFACTIVGVLALADATGRVAVDIWRDSYGNYPAVDADSITGASPVTSSNNTKSRDLVLSGWKRTPNAQDILRFNVDSVSTLTYCGIVLLVARSM